MSNFRAIHAPQANARPGLSVSWIRNIDVKRVTVNDVSHGEGLIVIAGHIVLIDRVGKDGVLGPTKRP
jgi:hypothetical protein